MSLPLAPGLETVYTILALLVLNLIFVPDVKLVPIPLLNEIEVVVFSSAEVLSDGKLKLTAGSVSLKSVPTPA